MFKCGRGGILGCRFLAAGVAKGAARVKHVRAASAARVCAGLGVQGVAKPLRDGV